MDVLMMIDIWIVRRAYSQLRKRADQAIDSGLLCRCADIIARIKVFCLRITVCITKNVGNARFDATLNHEQITQEHPAQRFIVMIEHDDVFKRHAVPIHFCGFVFEGMLVATDQREVADLCQRTLRGIFICDDEMLAFQQRDLLIVSNKWLWHRNTSLVKKGTPAGIPPVAGLAGFCNAITDDSIAQDPTFVKAGFAIMIILCKIALKIRFPIFRQ